MLNGAPNEKDKHQTNLKNWEYVCNLKREEYFSLGYKNSKNTRGWYKCRICHNMIHVANGKFKRNKILCQNGCHGGDSNKLIKGVNDLATTHPYLIKFFVNKEEAHQHKAKSSKRTKFKCPHCNLIKEGTIYNLANYGLSCPVCGDGYSFPEKFISTVLAELGLDFISQFKFESFNKKYDFYIPSLDIIIEAHGSQHYQGEHRGQQWKTYEEEHENDLIKYDIAVAHGYEFNKNYFIIDCRRSEWEAIKTSLLSSKLSNILEFNQVDWNKCFSKSKTSVMAKACELYKMGYTRAEISKRVGCDVATVLNYLKQGTMINLCDYNPDISRKERYERLNKRVVMVDIPSNKIVGVYKSVSECSRCINYDEATIASLALGKRRNTHKVTSKKLGGEYAFFYLDSTDWESVKHLYMDDKGLLVS